MITDTGYGNEALDCTVIELDARQAERLFKNVHDFLGRFVVYPSSHAHVAHTLWIGHTHLMPKWDSTPRIAFLSPEPASGKSRALEVSELLVPHPVTSVNVSPAYLFRKVGSEEGATILFDEIDTVFGPKAKDNEDIRGLLNAGHRQGATAGRCVNIKGSEIRTEEIPAYAAVALAGLGWLPDTIMGRSIIVRMRRRRQGESVEPFRRRLVEPEGRDLCQALDAWAQTVGQINWPELPPGIEDRNADVWEAIITVADLIGGQWPQLARDAAVAIVAEAKDMDRKSLGIQLLADVRTVFGTADNMSSKAILKALVTLDEAPWGDLKGKPLDERGLASRLRQYGVKSKTVRIGDTTAKGYTRQDLYDQWASYLPPLPANFVTSVTSDTGPERWAQNVPDAVTDAVNVTDAAPDVTRVVTFPTPHKPNKTCDMSPVTSVTNLAGDTPERVCRQCNAPGATERHRHEFSTGKGWQMVWLHAECRSFWLAEQSNSQGETNV